MLFVFIDVICIYLCYLLILVSYTISISDDVRLLFV